MVSVLKSRENTFAHGRAMSVVADYGSLAAKELAQVNRIWTDLARRGYTAGLTGGMSLMRCRTPQDLIAAQAALLCDELDILRGGCGEISEIVASAAAEAVRLIGHAPDQPSASLQALA